MAKRRYAVDRLKIISEEMAGLPKLLKISIYMGAIAILLAGVSIYFQLQSMRLLHRAETKHRTFINRITNAKLLGDAWQLGDRKRSVDGAEVDASEQKQCRHRQKTEWVYFDGDSVDSEGTITVDFTGSEGYTVSTASCAASLGSVNSLKQSGQGLSKIYHCVCKADASQLKEDHLGYGKLTCTANYWECPVK